MAKKVFIFESSPGWNYCGGMVVVVEKDFDSAVKLALTHVDEDGNKDVEDHKFYKKLSDIPELEAWYFEDPEHNNYKQIDCSPDDPKATSFNKSDGWDEWVLSRVYDVPEETKNEVLVNYNYA